MVIDDDSDDDVDDRVDDNDVEGSSCSFGLSAKGAQLLQLFMTMIVSVIRNQNDGDGDAETDMETEI